MYPCIGMSSLELYYTHVTQPFASYLVLHIAVGVGSVEISHN
jgi:hypothetical protein